MVQHLACIDFTECTDQALSCEEGESGSIICSIQ